MILIGSKAVKFWYPDFRDTKDTDWITPNPPEKKLGVEYHYSRAFDWLLEREGLIASPDALYTIKVSHSFWPIHWQKTMHDIVFLKSKGCKVIEEFYIKLYADWEERHGKKHVNLNVSNEKFFNGYVERKYEHDDLHRAVMYYDEPMYDKLKKDKSKAWIDRSMFDALSQEDKLKTCREELCVITLERELIPSDFKVSLPIAYNRAAKALVTRMSKGWFPRFIVENWDELRKFDHNRKFLNVVKNKGI